MFSVIIPVFNHARFISEAIVSALRSPLVTEILVLDDGSADESSAIVRRFAAAHRDRVRDLTSADGGNRGAQHRLNELVSAARCEWVAPLNSDDVLISGRFESLVSDELFRHSDFIFGNLLLMNEKSILLGAKRGPFDVSAPFPSSFDVAAMVAAGEFVDLLAHQNYLVTTSNMIFRKDLHARTGGFREYRYVHDWDFALRAMAIGRPLYVRRYVTTYRLHPSNTVKENVRCMYEESKHFLDTFVAELPRVADRPLFSAGLEHNPNLIACRNGRSETLARGR